jgi:hypothetical protein
MYPLSDEQRRKQIRGWMMWLLSLLAINNYFFDFNGMVLLLRALQLVGIN